MKKPSIDFRLFHLLKIPNPQSPIPNHRSLSVVALAKSEPITNIQYPISNIQSNPTLAVCLDADRLDLGRVGITPDPLRLSTATAREMARLLDTSFQA